jgi:hypothetical protein
VRLCVTKATASQSKACYKPVFTFFLQGAPTMTAKFQKNKAQMDELLALAKQVNLPVRDMLMSDEHFEASSAIFYKGMPKLVRMTMNATKFKTFYQNNREKIINDMFPAA